MQAPAIQQDIAGAGIEAANRQFWVGRQDTDIGHPAEIQDDPFLFFTAIEGAVKGRYQRCSLASYYHIPATEVSDSSNTAKLSDGIAVADLNGIGRGGVGGMADSLPVAADSLDSTGIDGRLVQELADCLSAKAAEPMIGLGTALDFIFSRRGK